MKSNNPCESAIQTFCKCQIHCDTWQYEEDDKQKNHDNFDGFTINVFLDEDGDYVAHFVEMPNVSAFSNTPENALRELAIAWKGVKDSYGRHHDPIPQ